MTALVQRLRTYKITVTMKPLVYTDQALEKPTDDMILEHVMEQLSTASPHFDKKNKLRELFIVKVEPVEA